MGYDNYFQNGFVPHKTVFTTFIDMNYVDSLFNLSVGCNRYERR